MAGLDSLLPTPPPESRPTSSFPSTAADSRGSTTPDSRGSMTPESRGNGIHDSRGLNAPDSRLGESGCEGMDMVVDQPRILPAPFTIEQHKNREAYIDSLHVALRRALCIVCRAATPEHFTGRKNPSMVFGMRLNNLHLPSFLKVSTADWDILSSCPEYDANFIRMQLEQQFTDRRWFVRSNLMPRSYQVVSLQGAHGAISNLVDITLIPEKVDELQDCWRGYNIDIGDGSFGTIAFLKLDLAMDWLKTVLINNLAPHRRTRDVQILNRMYYATTTGFGSEELRAISGERLLERITDPAIRAGITSDCPAVLAAVIPKNGTMPHTLVADVAAGDKSMAAEETKKKKKAVGGVSCQAGSGAVQFRRVKIQTDEYFVLGEVEALRMKTQTLTDRLQFLEQLLETERVEKELLQKKLGRAHRRSRSSQRHNAAATNESSDKEKDSPRSIRLSDVSNHSPLATPRTSTSAPPALDDLLVFADPPPTATRPNTATQKAKKSKNKKGQNKAGGSVAGATKERIELEAAETEGAIATADNTESEEYALWGDARIVRLLLFVVALLIVHGAAYSVCSRIGPFINK